MNEQIILWYFEFSHEYPTVITANASERPALGGHSAI